MAYAFGMRSAGPGHIDLPTRPPLSQDNFASGSQNASDAPLRKRSSPDTPSKAPVNDTGMAHNPSGVTKPVSRSPANRMTPSPRPTIDRASGSYRTHISPPAWVGAALSPNINVQPEAIDYFYGANAQMRSWRAAYNLALLVGGRCVVSLGLGGILQAYVPGSLDAPKLKPAVVGSAEHLGRTMFHPTIFWLSLVGSVVGLALHCYGVERFFHDTASINRRRAYFIASGGVLGAIAVAGGGAQYIYASINQDKNATWQALPVRAVGNFLVFFCLPSSFSSSEVVHGVLPIEKSRRIWFRDLSLATGGACFQIYSQVSGAEPPGPLYARELTQVVAIIGVAIGAALPRVDALNAQADAREARRQLAIASPP